jgi:hypothetical protein
LRQYARTENNSKHDLPNNLHEQAIRVDGKTSRLQRFEKATTCTKTHKEAYKKARRGTQKHEDAQKVTKKHKTQNIGQGKVYR